MRRSAALAALAALCGALCLGSGCYNAEVRAGGRLPPPPELDREVYAAQGRVRVAEEGLDVASTRLNQAIQFRLQAARELRGTQAAMAIQHEDRAAADPLALRLRMEAASAKYSYALANERYARDVHEARLAERQLAEAVLTRSLYDEQPQRDFKPPVGDAAEPWSRTQYETLPQVDSEAIRERIRASQFEAARQEQLARASLEAARAQRTQWLAARQRWLAGARLGSNDG
jgi:hypothetical protein